MGYNGDISQYWLKAASGVGATSITLRDVPFWARKSVSYVRVDHGTADAEMRRVTPAGISGAVATLSALAYAHIIDDAVVWEKLPILRPCDFGASTGGTAGSNFTAIQRLLDQVAKVGPCTIVFPEQYEINDKLVGTNLYNCRITGNAGGSNYATAYGGLKMASTVEKTILLINQTGGAELGLKIDHLYLYGNRHSADHTYTEILAAMAAEAGHGIQLDTVSRVEIAHSVFWGMVGHGLTGVGSASTINLLNAHDNWVQDCARKGIDLTNVADSWVHANEVGTSGKGIYKASVDEHVAVGSTYPTDASLEISYGIFVGNNTNEIWDNRVYQTVGDNIYVLGDYNNIHDNNIDGSTRAGILLLGCEGNLVRDNNIRDHGVTYTPATWSHELDAGRNSFSEVGCGIYLETSAIRNSIIGNTCNVFNKSFGTESFRDGQINGILDCGRGNIIQANVCEGNSNDGIQARGSHAEIHNNICRFNSGYGIRVNGTAASDREAQVSGNKCHANETGGIYVVDDGDAHIWANNVEEPYGTTAATTLSADASGGDTVISLTSAANWTAGDIIIITSDTTADRGALLIANWVLSVATNDVTLYAPLPGVGVIATSGNAVRKRTQDYGIRLHTDAGNVRLGENNFGNAITTDLSIGGGTVTYTKYNSGTATVINTATTSVVTHAMSRTPSINDIKVTPTNDLGDATKFWISTITATQFTINVDVDPGVDTATFVWAININS